MRQITAAIGEVIGKTVKYLPVTAEAERQATLEIGMDEWMANLLGSYSAA